MNQPRFLLLLIGLCLASSGLSQEAGAGAGTGAGKADEKSAKLQELEKRQKDFLDSIRKAEVEGVPARIKDIARFRGVRANQLIGTGLIIGLQGQGDSSRSSVTRSIMSNLLKDFGTLLEPTELNMKNVAAVMITAELPPFSSNGQVVDVTVTSMGDAKSLVGGTLLQAPLYAAGDRQTVYAMAQGQITVGGFDVSSGGSGSRKNVTTAGRIANGAIVERGAPTKLTYDGKMYLELNDSDLTTAQRLEQKIREIAPQFAPKALHGGTVELSLPAGMSEVQAMAVIEPVEVMVDTPATIVINEKTGTIVIGGNVRVAPAAVVHGSISVRIQSELIISQPSSFSDGTTVVANQQRVDVEEAPPQIAVLPPMTTVSDLVRIFQVLDLKAADIISILQALKQQGALKARIVSQ